MLQLVLPQTFRLLAYDHIKLTCLGKTTGEMQTRERIIT